MRATLLLSIAILSGCTAAGGPYPSLQPRAAETIDPRVPIVRPVNDRAAAPALMQRLAALVGQAEGGDGAFSEAAATSERLAANAGAPQSESWIAEKEALTAAIAARKPTATALGDIDEIAATALQNQGGIAPGDLAAIKSAADRVGAMDRRQSERIDAIQKRLGL